MKKMTSLMQAIKSKISSNSNTANTKDSETETSSKASDDEDFFDEIYSKEEPSQKNKRQILESFSKKKKL